MFRGNGHERQEERQEHAWQKEIPNRLVPPRGRVRSFPRPLLELRPSRSRNRFVVCSFKDFDRDRTWSIPALTDASPGRGGACPARAARRRISSEGGACRRFEWLGKRSHSKGDSSWDSWNE